MSAWNATIKATMFAFPHREDELREYGDYMDREFELEAEGLLAIAIQHEYDHLQGVLMIDHLGPLKRRLLHRKMLKRPESHAEPTNDRVDQMIGLAK